ncbi:MAG TPA: protein kinase [Myxococcaceae bacterium]
MPRLDALVPQNVLPGVITFYSVSDSIEYSTTVAAVARRFSRHGRKVLVVDWDPRAVAAQGLLPGPQESSGVRPPTSGLVEVLSSLVGPRPISWADSVSTLRPAGDSREIHVLSTMRTGAQAAEPLDLEKLFESPDLGRKLESMRAEWLRAYDAVLVNSPPGVSVASGICAVNLPDALVAFYTPDPQSIRQTRSALRSVMSEHAHLPADRRNLVTIPFLTRGSSGPGTPEVLQQAAEDLGEFFTASLPRSVKPIDAIQLFSHGPDESYQLASLLDGGMTSLPAASFPIRFGKYELLGRIAQGGMGIVYRARQLGVDPRTVALKMMLAGDRATDAEKHRFLREAQTAATLVHPNIVPIYEIAEHEGCPYFTMQLIEGKSLADHVREFRHDRGRRAAKLMVAVAQAVNHAHQHLIAHRDLKPANILLDAEGTTPLVTDFGLAVNMVSESGLTEPGTIVGTLPYMSPEQAAGQTLTTRSDVYSLGAVLYKLLTGRPPVLDDEAAEKLPLYQMLRLLQKAEPVWPRQRDRSIPRDLEALCLKCLEKDPERRYSSTELVKDLERFLRNERLAGASPKGFTARVVGWISRHLVTTTIAMAVALLVVANAASLWLTRAEASNRRAAVREANVNAAQTLAGSVLAQLGWDREAVTKAAGDLPPALAADLLQPWPHGQDELERYCRTLYELHNDPGTGLRTPEAPPPVNTWFILDREGIARARWPIPPREFHGKDYPWRDYFQGARKLAEKHLRSAHVSRAFLSESDDTLKFALSAPLYGPDGAWVGVIVAMADSGATLGTLRLRDWNAEYRIAALVGPQDHSRKTAQDLLYPSDYAILAHASIGLDHLRTISNQRILDVVARVEQSTPGPGLEQFQLAGPDAVTFDEDYRDPLEGYGGRWLAGFAPVGHTGFVVIVQTPDDTTVQPGQILILRLLSWGVYLALGLLVALLISRRWSARTRAA